jgi:homoserine kinase
MKMPRKVTVFAPASIGNIGPGFDVLGMALAGIGDEVVASRIPERKVVIREILGDAGKLPREAERNTAGIAALSLLDRLEAREGVELSLKKGVPGTGLGSSAASAVAASFAVNLLFGERLKKEELIPLAAQAESSVSGGYFLDNVGPSMMGGITWNHPFSRTVIQLGRLPRAVVVVATPDFPLLTKESRKVLPKEVPIEVFIFNLAQASLMTWAAAKGNLELFGRSIIDRMAEPARAPLITGFADVKAAAIEAGALGCSISGAGASVFAVTGNLGKGERIGVAMEKAFRDHGASAKITVTRIDRWGARKVEKKGIKG